MLKLTTDKQTNKQTDRTKNNMPPIIRSGGIKIERSIRIFYHSVVCLSRNIHTSSYIHNDCKVLKDVLQKDSETLIKWFDFKSMKANPDKFQAICLGKKGQ